MALVRSRRLTTIDAAVADAPPRRPLLPDLVRRRPARPGPSSALLAAEAGTALATGRLRRCTFRRLDPGPAVARDGVAGYSVECLYPGPEGPAMMGSLAVASRICASCTASGVFRPDED